MKSVLIIFSIGMAMLLAACSSQQPVTSLPVSHVRQMGETPVSDGFFYMLPITVATVDVSVTRTESTPGPFADYAERYLGLEEVIEEPSVEYEISQVSIDSYAEPDPEHVYFVPFSALKNDSIFVSLSQTGLIQSVNKHYGDHTESANGSQTEQYGFFDTEATFNHFVDLNLREKIDTIREYVRQDTITSERQTLRRSWVEKSIDIRAREVADFIIQIREKKFDLINGFAEIPYSKEALEYMYTEMSNLEESYLQLFKGITSESTISYRYSVRPDAVTENKNYPLFRFSSREGILNAGRQDGYEVSLEMQPNGSSQNIPPLPPAVPGAPEQGTGFYYRIPELAKVVLWEGNVLRAETRMLINQFGAVSRMAPSGMQMEFYPETGSVKSIGKGKDN